MLLTLSHTGHMMIDKLNPIQFNSNEKEKKTGEIHLDRLPTNTHAKESGDDMITNPF